MFKLMLKINCCTITPLTLIITALNTASGLTISLHGVGLPCYKAKYKTIIQKSIAGYIF